MLAEPAIAIGATHPGDAYAGAGGDVGGGSVDYFADDLVAGDEAGTEWREITFNDVEVGAANSAGQNAEEEMAGLKRRARNVFDAEMGLVGSG
jgi:hypothetical protein